jgi:multidrug efflux pump subunit AcrA (membrane-fusion protein)
MKIYAYLAAALLLAGLVGGAVHIIRKANRVDVAEAKAKAAEQRALDIAETAAKAAAQERDISQALAQFRGELGAQSQSFRDALSSQPITREVPHVVNGQTITCRERDPARYRELFNQAVTGTAGP